MRVEVLEVKLFVALGLVLVRRPRRRRCLSLRPDPHRALSGPSGSEPVPVGGAAHVRILRHRAPRATMLAAHCALERA